jgi:hypothetical protein
MRKEMEERDIWKPDRELEYSDTYVWHAEDAPREEDIVEMSGV